ncbi:MAG TPA: hypothetical protein VJP76_07340 [Candidatus Tumulicola sp.]|nr:hypothetical protein [Candidatus Tumulicola sp.]
MAEHLGSDSDFHKERGFYVDAVKAGKIPILPDGWGDRVLSRALSWENPERHVNKKCEVLFLEIHDLAASKLAAFRGKDQVFVESILRNKYVNKETLLERVGFLPLPDKQRDSIREFIRLLPEH